LQHRHPEVNQGESISFVLLSGEKRNSMTHSFGQGGETEPAADWDLGALNKPGWRLSERGKKKEGTLAQFISGGKTRYKTPLGCRGVPESSAKVGRKKREEALAGKALKGRDAIFPASGSAFFWKRGKGDDRPFRGCGRTVNRGDTGSNSISEGGKGGGDAGLREKGRMEFFDSLMTIGT